MSEGLRERFINALTATIELFDTINEDHAKRIAKLEEANKRLQGEIHEMQFEIKRLKKDIAQRPAEPANEEVNRQDG